MKIGFIISMYDEIDVVKKNIEFLKSKESPVIVIQSQPSYDNQLLESSLVDHYELLPDMGGNKENYEKERKESIGYRPGHMLEIPAKALTRNFSHAFRAASKFDVDWWVVLLGDCKVTGYSGIEIIINKMKNEKKYVGITRGVGLLYPDDLGHFYARVQWFDTTDFFPQFFIVSTELVKNSFFHDMHLTNKWGTEICLGDNVIEYCKKNKLNYWDIVYSICDYPAPKWIKGFSYAKDRTTLPSFLLGPMNLYRRLRMRIFHRKYLNAKNVTKLPYNFKEK